MSSFEKTMQFQRMLSSLAVLAVFIACLGLIGLVAFIIEKRNKEIGIRKVLGASTIHILLLLSGNFGKLLLIGFIISAPLTWQIMQQWLTNFDLRTSISLYTFFFAGAIMLLVAALTMSFQTVRASRVNPVDYLKEE